VAISLFLCWFNRPSIEPEYFGAINMIAPAKEKLPQNLQIAKQDGLTHLHQNDFLMNYVICVSQISFYLLFVLQYLNTYIPMLF